MFEEAYHIETKAADLEIAVNAPEDPIFWRYSVLSTLSTIVANPVGKILLQALAGERLWTIIQPHWWLTSEAVRSVGVCNADTHKLARFSGTGAKQNRYYGALVRFSPRNFAGPSPCGRGKGPLSEPHQILFHELVHAYRMNSKKHNSRDLAGGLKDHVNNEEFYGVLLTNIYGAADGKSMLRASHMGHSAMQREFQDSFGFFQMGRETYTLVGQFWLNHPSFCWQLCQVRATFNPIKAYRENHHKARQLSESERAKARDKMSLSQLTFPYDNRPNPFLQTI